MKRRLASLILPVAFAALVGRSQACSVCYGDAGSPMSDGLTWAITLMVGVVGAVLAGVVAFFVQSARKSTSMIEVQRPENQI